MEAPLTRGHASKAFIDMLIQLTHTDGQEGAKEIQKGITFKGRLKGATLSNYSYESYKKPHHHRKR